MLSCTDVIFVKIPLSSYHGGRGGKYVSNILALILSGEVHLSFKEKLVMYTDSCGWDCHARIKRIYYYYILKSHF